MNEELESNKIHFDIRKKYFFIRTVLVNKNELSRYSFRGKAK